MIEFSCKHSLFSLIIAFFCKSFLLRKILINTSRFILNFFLKKQYLPKWMQIYFIKKKKYSKLKIAFNCKTFFLIGLKATKVYLTFFLMRFSKNLIKIFKGKMRWRPLFFLSFWWFFWGEIVDFNFIKKSLYKFCFFLSIKKSKP